MVWIQAKKMSERSTLAQSRRLALGRFLVPRLKVPCRTLEADGGRLKSLGFWRYSWKLKPEDKKSVLSRD